MKSIFTFSFLIASFFSNAQVMCGTATEGSVVTLTAPAGYVFSSIEFASYGTPTGSCGSFATSTCHATNSVSIVSAAFIGLNSASINATNAVFGDPCGGTVKRLYIQAAYSLALPLKLVSFTAGKSNDNEITLNWSSANENNSSHFIIERSTDGVLFSAVGTLPAHGMGDNKYRFTHLISPGVSNYYYRLKIVDKDDRFEYSPVLRMDNLRNDHVSLIVYPNPANNHITIISHKLQEAVIVNIHGQQVQKLLLMNGSQTLPIVTWKAGVYFMKTVDGVKMILKK